MRKSLYNEQRLQNDVLIGKNCLTMIGSLLREPIFCLMAIKTADCRVFRMAARCEKWLPAMCFRMDLSLYRHRKMAALWRIFAARWGISPIGTHWTGFQCISMGFLLSLDDNFVLQRFCWNGLSLSSKAPLYLKSCPTEEGQDLFLVIPECRHATMGSS